MRKYFLIYQLLLTTCCITGAIPALCQLKASFSASPVQGCAPVLINFTDQSAGSPTYWRWELGNGTVSFLQNPATTYFNPGTYTIKLVVRNGSRADSVIQVNYIIIHASPVVNFSA